jgi:hypothetical protein
MATAAIVGGSLLGSAVAARGASSAARTQAGAAQAGIDETQRQFDVTRQDFRPFLQAGQNALPQFLAGIDQAPDAPQLQQFGGQAVQAPTLQQAPQLQQFQFDPRAALDNPALQFQREMGQQQVERAAGANRQLGSGQRLIAAQQFGQGLASQSLDDEFRRQLAMNQAQNQAAAQQFGLGTQRDIQQFGLGSQQLGQEQALAQQEQNRLLTQFGLTSDQFNQRLNRLGGLVDVGRGTAGSLATAGGQASANTANLLLAQGQAGAAGQLGRANIIGSAIQQAVGGAALGGAFNPQQAQNPLAGGGFTTGGQVFAGPTRINQ